MSLNYEPKQKHEHVHPGFLYSQGGFFTMRWLKVIFNGLIDPFVIEQ